VLNESRNSADQESRAVATVVDGAWAISTMTPGTVLSHRITVEYRDRLVPVATRLRKRSDHLVVFLHGLGCDQESFTAAFDRAELSEFSVCTFDFPGHGESGKLPPDAYSLQAYADITLAVVAAFRPGRVSLVCHSMGGAVGLLASQDLPDIARFVSIEGNLVAEDCGLISRRIAAQSGVEFARTGHAELRRKLTEAPDRGSRAWARWVARCDPSAVHACASSLVEWSDSGKLLDLFQAIQHTAYVHGGLSEQDHLRPVLGATPRHSIPRAAHFAMLDNPNATYAALRTALTATGRATRTAYV